ncbi:NAD(P)-dependent oxidoreductase [Enorma phocaeensis]|uniref:NAD(P)-dependent oxidoreductase n=1 Tax=Enorma phocaeensis TaxID=1871019 RepID=UPI000C81BC45|nr:NAD(P)-dependent oxidoreductase [Enorma phocaeensis]
MDQQAKHISIAITNSSSFGYAVPEHIERLEKLGAVKRVDVPGDCHGAELAEAVGDANIIISSGTPQFDKEFFACKPDMLLVARDGLGFNNVDVDAARACGCYVTKVQKVVEREAVAECAVGEMLDLIRQFSAASRAANENRWLDRGQFVGMELRGRTVGIIGCGNIGSRVAEILHHGFGMRVLANDPVHDDEWAQKNDVTYVDLDTLLAESDVVTFHATLNPTSFHLADEDFYKKIKRGAYVINTARGDMLDQAATVAALEDGTISGLAIDAMSVEPPAPDDPFLNNPRVLVTPHIGAYTVEALGGMGEICVKNAELVARGEKPVNIVWEQ